MSTYWSISITIPGESLGYGKSADDSLRNRKSCAAPERPTIEVEDITAKLLKLADDSPES